MNALPKFTLGGYRDLLLLLRDQGARFSPMSKIEKSACGDVFLRHDIDISLELALPMARLERGLGIASTYYILLSGPYNPLSASSISAMKELVSLGHDLGLHYDLTLYPHDEKSASLKLSREIDILGEASGVKIETIVMHAPFLGHSDIFEGSTEWVNPTFFQKNNPRLMYVSDSCRAWRDKSLLDYLNGKPETDRLLLNVHPESWLAERSVHRLTYLEKILLPMTLEPTRRYLMETVRPVWQSHVGPVSGYGDEDEDE
ncbi:MAG: hypothetical protein KJ989_14170 [Gammaproteobacteria bacterium]|nr:hypothetical protein [Gammaproteobacteria bacterium]MBU2158123.1 hypothetical protein [Gammaproteobacteria bacterium]MBU2255735.1 hypothetical protein [Gammaproteobacteria bacterium]MBU2295345.1 hypothetical protein [Gammaproteobacteria bacterium]